MAIPIPSWAPTSAVVGLVAFVIVAAWLNPAGRSTVCHFRARSLFLSFRIRFSSVRLAAVSFFVLFLRRLTSFLIFFFATVSYPTLVRRVQSLAYIEAAIGLGSLVVSRFPANDTVRFDGTEINCSP